MPEELPYLLESLPFRPFDFFAQVAAVVATCAVIPRFKITGLLGPVLLVLALGFINTVYWSPKLFYALPNSFSMQTIALMVINGGIFWALVKILPDLEIKGLFAAIASPITFSLLSALISTYGRDIDYAAVLKVAIDFIANSFSFFRALVGGLEGS
jgi:uncharacterized membrane protein YvlD (DUF360 family)